MASSEKILNGLQESKRAIKQECDTFEQSLSEHIHKHNPWISKLNSHKARVSAVNLQISQGKEEYKTEYRTMIDHQNQAKQAELKVDRLRDYVEHNLKNKQSDLLPTQLEKEHDQMQQKIQRLRQTRDTLQSELRRNQKLCNRMERESALYRQCLGLSIKVPRRDDLQIVFHGIGERCNEESITLTMIKSTKDPRKIKRYDIRECSISVEITQQIRDRYLKDLNRHRMHLRQFLAKVRQIFIDYYIDNSKDPSSAAVSVSDPHSVSMSDGTVIMMDQSRD